MFSPEVQRDIALERKRELARERKRRHDARKRAAAASPASPVTPARNGNGNGNAVTVSPRVRKVVAAIAQGEPMQRAMVKAGFHPTSKPIREQAIAGLQQSLAQGGVTVDTVVASVAKRLEATSPMQMLDSEGRCIERPDWTAQATGSRDAIALLDRAGVLPAPSQATGGGAQIVVNVVRFGDVRPQDLAVEADASEDNADAIDVTP